MKCFSPAILLIGIVLLANTEAGFAKETPMKTPLNYAVAANCDFGLDLYRQLAKENEGKNLFFSPYSMSVALAMAAEGARGETALQMGKVLHFPDEARRSGADAASNPWNGTLVDSGLAGLSQRYNAQKECEMRVANALWGEKTFRFAKSYVDTIDKFFGTDSVRPVDFVRNAQGVRGLINAWVAEQTSDRIKDLIPSGALTARSVLVLTNAIYFKGDWVEPFQAAATKEDDFFMADGKKGRLPLMHRAEVPSASYAAFNGDGTFFDTPTMAGGPRRMRPGGMGGPQKVPAFYPDQDGFTMLALPYKGDQLSLVVLLPQTAGGLPALETMLTPANLQAWLGKLKPRKVNVFLPKFKLETSYEMKDALVALGMVRAFGGGEGAQFNGMCENQKPELCISKVVHKAFVDVNEQGTEAAAATGVVMVRAAIAMARPFTPTFRADKPFVFLIYDQGCGNVVFLGRTTTP